VSITEWGPHENPERLIVLVLVHLGGPGETAVKRVGLLLLRDRGEILAG